MEKIFISLGSNIGNRKLNLKKALDILRSCGVEVIQESSLYEAEPWGVVGQERFLNRAVECRADMKALPFLELCLSVEKKMGRERDGKWEPRIIDIDLIFYGDFVGDSPECVVPHSLMHKRRFVLEPLDEIAGGFFHPVLKKTVHELLKDCDDSCGVVKV